MQPQDLEIFGDYGMSTVEGEEALTKLITEIRISIVKDSIIVVRQKLHDGMESISQVHPEVYDTFVSESIATNIGVWFEKVSFLKGGKDILDNIFYTREFWGMTKRSKEFLGLVS